MKLCQSHSIFFKKKILCHNRMECAVCCFSSQQDHNCVPVLNGQCGHLVKLYAVVLLKGNLGTVVNTGSKSIKGNLLVQATKNVCL